MTAAGVVLTSTVTGAPAPTVTGSPTRATFTEIFAARPALVSRIVALPSVSRRPRSSASPAPPGSPTNRLTPVATMVVAFAAAGPDCLIQKLPTRRWPATSR